MTNHDQSSVGVIRHGGPRRRRPLVLLGLAGVAVLVVAACGSDGQATTDPTTTASVTAAAPASSGVQLVDVAAARALIADPSIVVVDVRTAAEFAEGHLDRAELVDIKAADFPEQIARLDRSGTYLVYCHAGNRSAQATAMMTQLGFSKVYELEGGIAAWQGAGAPVVK